MAAAAEKFRKTVCDANADGIHAEAAHDEEEAAGNRIDGLLIAWKAARKGMAAEAGIRLLQYYRYILDPRCWECEVW